MPLKTRLAAVPLPVAVAGEGEVFAVDGVGGGNQQRTSIDHEAPGALGVGSVGLEGIDVDGGGTGVGVCAVGRKGRAICWWLRAR